MPTSKSKYINLKKCDLNTTDLRYYINKVLKLYYEPILRFSFYKGKNKKNFIMNIYYPNYVDDEYDSDYINLKLDYKRDYIGSISYDFNKNVFDFKIGKKRYSIRLLELSDKDKFLIYYKKQIYKYIKYSGYRYKLNLDKLLWSQHKEILSNYIDCNSLSIVKSFLIKDKKN